MHACSSLVHHIQALIIKIANGNHPLLEELFRTRLMCPLTYPDLLGPLKSSKKEIQQMEKCLYRTLSQHFKIIYHTCGCEMNCIDLMPKKFLEPTSHINFKL